jgi:hypothetical protein
MICLEKTLSLPPADALDELLEPLPPLRSKNINRI